MPRPPPVRLRPGDRAVAQLRAWLTAGRWPPGARIAGELALVDELGVSRRTVRAALAALEGEGLIASRGRGGRVAVAAGGLPAGRLAGAIALVSATASADYAGAYLAAVDSAALRAAQGAGHDVLVVAPGRLDPAAIRRDRPLGVVLGPYPSSDRALVESLSGLPGSGIPVAVLGDEPWQARLDRVVFDHRAGGRAVAGWLIAHGRRRLACLWAPAARWQEERAAGVAEACADAGLPPPIHLPLPPDERGEPAPERFAARVAALLPALAPSCAPTAPDALLALSDSHVYPLNAALRRLGRQPGEDILVAGYDGYAAEAWERAYEAVGPAVSADKDNRAAGAALVRLVVDRAAGRLPAAPQRVVVAPRLVPG